MASNPEIELTNEVLLDIARDTLAKTDLVKNKIEQITLTNKLVNGKSIITFEFIKQAKPDETECEFKTGQKIKFEL